jgi:hypothetical protein
MPRLDTVLFVLLAMPAAAFANAESTRNARETRAERRQMADVQDWNERDAREVSEFERLACALRDASEDRMTGRYREVNARVQEAMTREIEQAQVKSAQAAHEARLAGREVSGDRMQASYSADAMDMFETRDDVRDLRDDTRDRDHTLARYEEMARVGTMSTALQNRIERGDPRAMKRNVELARKFLELMRRDFEASRAEAVEDRAEQREDSGATARPGGR